MKHILIILLTLIFLYSCNKADKQEELTEELDFSTTIEYTLTELESLVEDYEKFCYDFIEVLMKVQEGDSTAAATLQEYHAVYMNWFFLLQEIEEDLNETLKSKIEVVNKRLDEILSE